VRSRDFEVSVTEVRNALRCPRIFVLGRTQRDCVAFPVGASTLGAVFHRIVERFSRALETPPKGIARLGRGASPDGIAEELSAWLIALLMDLLEEEPTYWTMPAEVDDLAEALRELAGYMAHLIVDGAHRPASALAELLQHAELPLEGTVAGLIGVYAFFEMNQLIIAYHVTAGGDIVLGEEIAEIMSVPPERIKPWPFGTGYAVSDWLKRRK